MFHSKTVQYTALTLALTTLFGVLVHDTKLDKATTIALTVPIAALMSYELGAQAIPKLSSDGHTHVERVSLGNAVRDLHSGTPRIQPRDDHKKFTLQKNVVKGVHAFDGYYAPLGSL